MCRYFIQYKVPGRLCCKVTQVHYMYVHICYALVTNGVSVIVCNYVYLQSKDEQYVTMRELLWRLKVSHPITLAAECACKASMIEIRIIIMYFITIGTVTLVIC